MDMSATATRGADEAAILARKPQGDRLAALREMSKRSGLDQGEVEQFLTREGPLGLLSGGERDAAIWRFMAAWERRDAQGMIDVLLWENRMRLVSRHQSATLLNRAMKEDKGAGMLFSDLAHGATKGRAAGSYRHSDDYYTDEDCPSCGKPLETDGTYKWCTDPVNCDWGNEDEVEESTAG